MSTLYITEFDAQGRDGKNVIAPATQVPPVAEQTVTISGVSNPSNAFNARTGIIRVISDVVCSIAIGAAPTAAATNMRLAANSAEYFTVPLGSQYKVAVISNT